MSGDARIGPEPETIAMDINPRTQEENVHAIREAVRIARAAHARQDEFREQFAVYRHVQEEQTRQLDRLTKVLDELMKSQVEVRTNVEWIRSSLAEKVDEVHVSSEVAKALAQGASREAKEAKEKPTADITGRWLTVITLALVIIAGVVGINLPRVLVGP